MTFKARPDAQPDEYCQLTFSADELDLSFMDRMIDESTGTPNHGLSDAQKAKLERMAKKTGKGIEQTASVLSKCIDVVNTIQGWCS